MKNKIDLIFKSLKKHKINTKVISRGMTKHLLIEGDCNDIVEYLPSGSIDLVITDPPYNKKLNYGNNFNDRKSWNEYYAWLKKRLIDIPRILSNKGSFYLISYPEINARLLPFLEDKLKLNYRRWITWHYPTNIGHSYKNFTRSQRAILFFTKKKDGYIFNRKHLIQPYKNPTAPVIRERLAKGYRGRTSYDLLRLTDLYELNKLSADVQEIHLLKNNSPERSRNLDSKFTPLKDPEKLKKIDHPCQLPLSLLELLTNVSSRKDSIIFDPFAGTFTTSAAAARLDRNSIGIELNKKFIKFGIKRIKNEQRQ